MNRKGFIKFGMLILIFLLSMVLFAACGSQTEEEGNQNSQEQQEETTGAEENQSEDSSESHFPITITDDEGREVIIESEPETMISFMPSTTEVAFALGLGDKIVGVSDYCNYPEAALEKTKIGARDMNAELVLQLLPDIAFVQDYHFKNHPETLDLYTEAGIKVIVIGSKSSFESVYESIELIANAMGVPENAEEIVSNMKQSLEDLKEKAEQITDKKKVWIEVSPAPDIFTTGKGTFMHEMLESIQAENAAGDLEGWVKLTEEEIVNLNPDVIITTYGYYVDNPSAGVLTRDGWAEVPAIKNQQVFDVDSDTVTRAGPRLIDGVESLAKFIYPEVFEE